LGGSNNTTLLTASQTCSKKDTYAITVEAGQDAALMVCVALVVDEIVRVVPLDLSSFPSAAA
jgi:uncharacterized protein YxjI